MAGQARSAVDGGRPKLLAIQAPERLDHLAERHGPLGSEQPSERRLALHGGGVRICFSTNDERTAKRVSDALGVATETRNVKNYAGHRLSPWLGHLMISRQETGRPLLTPGEVMQLPHDDELILVSGEPPIRAKKVRYFEDRQLADRVLEPPQLKLAEPQAAPASTDWSTILQTPSDGVHQQASATGDLRREPEMPAHEDPTAAHPAKAAVEFDFDEPEYEVSLVPTLEARARRIARQAALDPDDGMQL